MSTLASENDAFFHATNGKGRGKRTTANPTTKDTLDRLRYNVRVTAILLGVVSLFALAGAALGIVFILDSQGQINIGSPRSIETLASDMVALQLSIAAMKTLNSSTFVTENQLAAVVQALNLSANSTAVMKTLNSSTFVTENQLAAAIQELNLSANSTAYQLTESINAIANVANQPDVVVIGNFAVPDAAYESNERDTYLVVNGSVTTPSFGHIWSLEVKYTAAVQCSACDPGVAITSVQINGTTTAFFSLGLSSAFDYMTAASGYVSGTAGPSTNYLVGLYVQYDGQSNLTMGATTPGTNVLMVIATRVS